MKIRITLLVVFLAMLGMNPAFATAESAQDIVRVTADRVIDRLNAEREQLETNPERIYSLIDELVIPHFDFYNMSRWVLGRQNWRSASEQQQQKFVNEFRTLLVRTYAKALLEYSDEKIDYLPVENNPKSNIVRVKTLVKQAGSKPVPIDYSMHITDGEWKVIDVSVDGISLVATYRGSFASEVRKNGMDSLISKLTERNERLVNNSN